MPSEPVRLSLFSHRPGRDILKGTVDYFINNVFNYPTLAECYKVVSAERLQQAAPLL